MRGLGECSRRLLLTHCETGPTVVKDTIHQFDEFFERSADLTYNGQDRSLSAFLGELKKWKVN